MATTNTGYSTPGSVAAPLLTANHELARINDQAVIDYLARLVKLPAYLPGFPEPGNFTRAFKHWTGKTPAEFREEA
jgi:AraC-like DNA-binding protein